MKNELGIEVCCYNCKHYNGKGCTWVEEDNKRVFKTSRCWFLCDVVAYSKRIKELQEQQFTKEELQFIKNRLDECIEEWDVPDMVFMEHQILKKIEQTLKKSETKLNKQQ